MRQNLIRFDMVYNNKKLDLKVSTISGSSHFFLGCFPKYSIEQNFILTVFPFFGEGRDIFLMMPTVMIQNHKKLLFFTILILFGRNCS